MSLTVRDLLDLPPLLEVWSDERGRNAPTAAQLAGDLPRSTAYRLARTWPTTRVGSRLRVQTAPFVRDVLGLDLTELTRPETDVAAPAHAP